MKKLFLCCMSLMAFFSLAFMGCHRVLDLLDNSLYMKAKVDGEWVEVKGLLANYVEAVSFNIQAAELNPTNPRGITLTILPPTIESGKEYPMQVGSQVNIVGQYFEGADTYNTSVHPNGKIIITKYDKEQKIVEGTFYFTGYKNGNESATKQITEGAFRCKSLL